MQGAGCTISRLGENTSTKERITNSESDILVVEKVLAGDTDAFSSLVHKYQNRVYSAVLNYVYSPDEAMDITQETFVKAYTSLHRFNSSSSFYTWIYRIAINTAIDWLRKRKNRKVESLDDLKFTEVGFEPESKDMDSDPEKMLNKNELERTLRAAISMLTLKLRGVLVLHDVEGLSQEEISTILKIPVGTVKSRISRARAELKNILQKQGSDVL
jgi:RNA polymerase sigma-70 factor, ECF subfamily